MRFLFWNTHNTKDINKILCSMIVEQKSNIVILAEYEDIIEDLLFSRLFMTLNLQKRMAELIRP